jgi:hypothetical protein
MSNILANMISIEIREIWDRESGSRVLATIDVDGSPAAAGYGDTPQDALLMAAAQWAGED